MSITLTGTEKLFTLILRQLAALLPTGAKKIIRQIACGAPVVVKATEPNEKPTTIASLGYGENLKLFVMPGDIISDAILATGVWEHELSALLLNDAQQGGLLVEVGANLGYFSIIWAGATASNKVLAFEPVLRNVNLFQRSIALNHLDKQISVFPVAAGREVGMASFELGPEQQTGWGGIMLDASKVVAPTQVLTVPLDQVFRDTDVIDVLKIDVEGADTWVLEGSRKLLSEQRIKKVYYEQNHPRMQAIGVLPGAAEALLEELGYECQRLTRDSEEVVEWIAIPKRR